MTRNVGVVIPAAGSGARMGGVRKAFLELCGRPLLLHALEPFLQHPRVARVVVALDAESRAAPPAWLERLQQSEGPRLLLVDGGAERGDSVRAALEQLSGDVDTVLVHDAARPFVDRELIDRVLAAVRPDAGAVPGMPVADTIKEVADDGRVRATLARNALRAVQTPQGFPAALLRDAYRRAHADAVGATDDAALVERYGGTVVVVSGDARNAKITRPEDLAWAESLLQEMR